MKFLFTAGGSHATIFSVAPLATAARNAGHEILLAADEPLMETAEAIGLPAVVTPEPAMAPARFAALLDLAKDWPPDLIVAGPSYVPGAAATILGIPFVQQAWDISAVADVNRRAEAEMRRLEHPRLSQLPEPSLFIDVCPPSLRPSPTSKAQPMRWIPKNRQRRLEPWMYTRSKGRIRVLITPGTRAHILGTLGHSMPRLVHQLTLAGAEVLIAAPEGAAESFGLELGDVRIGWIPLDVTAPTCDLAVHHGGAATAMTFTSAGVPQLIIAQGGYMQAIGQALSDFGAALMVLPDQLGPDQDLADAIAAGCREILACPRFGQQTRALASEIASLPTPSEVVDMIERLPCLRR